MTEAGPTTFSHYGVCVSDMERSRRFYCEAFGFRPGALMHPGQECSNLVGIDGPLAMRCQFIVKDGLLMELIKYDSPGHVGTAEARPPNKLGLTHISFRVKDIEATMAKVEELGGTVMRQTRMTYDNGDGTGGSAIFCLDPDGTRVELMEFPDSIRFDRA